MLDLSSCRYNFTQATWYKLMNQHANVMFRFLFAYPSFSGLSLSWWSITETTESSKAFMGEGRALWSTRVKSSLPWVLSDPKSNWSLQMRLSTGSFNWLKKWVISVLSLSWLAGIFRRGTTVLSVELPSFCEHQRKTWHFGQTYKNYKSDYPVVKVSNYFECHNETFRSTYNK